MALAVHLALLALPATHGPDPLAPGLRPLPTARLTVSLLSSTEPSSTPEAAAPPAQDAVAQSAAPLTRAEGEGKAGRAAPGLPLPAGIDAELEYLPRSKLGAPAHPVTPVLVDYPDQVFVAGRVRVVLELFIDEAGVVRRIRADDEAQAPPALIEAAKTAFMAARFAPGQREDGRPAKSRMRIEVSFEAR